jgi:hypothetical protein
MSTAKKRAARWQPTFLASFRTTGNISRSAEAAGISRSTVWKHREKDPEFDRQYNEALDDAVDTLEAEAWRRAAEGIERTKVVRTGTDDDGNPVFSHFPERHYSDTLLIFLLKGLRPERYRDSYDLKGLLNQVVGHASPAPGGQPGDPPPGD